MGFVMPKEVAVEGVPDPKSDGVPVRKRDGGRFAVIRFSGQMDSKLAKKQEAKLREWIMACGLEGETKAEAAGYAPQSTPGPLRRNETLIRLKQPSDESQTKQVSDE